MSNSARLSVVVHTEEEFDWNAGFFASNNGVNHGEELIYFCQELIALGAKIVFAMDYAFVTSAQGQAVIHHFKTHHANDVEFATHLHPWVNPPFAEQDEVHEKDSYPGNLPAATEQAKLTILTETIENQVGYRPTTYLAGRYGVGENTYRILKELGYTVDLSITPFTDYRHQHGPDFTSFNNEEVITDDIRCITHSTGFVSYLAPFTDYLNKKAGNLDRLNNNLIGKILLKLLGVRKVRLSAEGYNSKDMLALSDSLIRLGVQHLLFSFHSPTVKMGITPYTKNMHSLNAFKRNTSEFLTSVKVKHSLTVKDTAK
ncbi:hypothetical protein [Alteromonas gilva]|uniref:WalW protein n=1 Tax=Alteromonas gilva TaxID=2987522 RepID=A0ABT5KZZ9_9ALTE|nr:hypothetical protein [Alteromonas gilva]MDC8830343.1 hypothetical protein [Alteromonas gilva]